MKTLKTILKNDDILARYKLVCLWAVDQFVNSLAEPNDALNDVINKTLLSETENEQQTPEQIHATLLSIRKTLIYQLEKLEKIQRHVNNLNTYIKLIGQVVEGNVEGEGEDKNDFSQQIVSIKSTIARIDNMSIQSIRELSTSV